MRRITAAALALLASFAAPARAGDDVASRPWRGAWIWRGSPAPMQLSMTGVAWTPPGGDANTTIQFRKVLTLGAKPTRAAARVTADSRYQLFVNGKFVARGPAPCDPLQQSFDVVDLTPHLTEGPNAIAAQVHFYGEDTGLWRRATGDWWTGSAAGAEDRAALGAGGFLCEVWSGEELLTATDASWRMRVAEEWKRPTPKVNPALGFVEVYDARVAPAGWTELQFDDSTWKRPCELEHAGRTRPPIEPYPALEARDVAPLSEEEIWPVRILTAGLVEDRLDENPAAAMRAERFVGREFPFEAVLGVPVKLAPGNATAASVVFDFGEEVVGFPVLDIGDAEEGAVLDVAWGERTWQDLIAFGRVHPELALPVPGDGRGVALDPIHGDTALRYVARKGAQRFVARERVGFRYLQVTARGKPMTLSAVNAIRVKYGVPMKGEFECSDPLLTEIWAAGKRTLESCLLDAFVDGPGREQRQYLGDARVQARVARAVLGDERPARRALRSFFLTPRADGMLPIVAPGDAARMGTVIPDYALHGIAMLAEYYEATGDGALVNEVWPSVVRVFDWFFARRRPDGLVGEVPGWVFLDWAQLDKTGANAVMNSLFVQALDAAGRARKDLKPWPIFDDLDTVRRIQDALVRFWDPERALFVDSLDSRGRRSARTSVHANASMVLSGAFGNERFAKWIAVLRQDPSLIVEPQSPLLPPKAIDDVKGIVGASPFFQGFVHEALARLGEHGFVLDDIRKRWGPMVAHGNRNLWEGWERTLDTSDCHAWSATPTAFLTEEILGVRFKVVREATGGTRVAITIAPHSGGLTSASGVVPAPSGPVRVAWEAKGGVITVVRGEVPPGATASVRFGATSRVVQPGRFEITPEN